VSSQGFKRYAATVHNDLDKEMAWLANGLQDALPNFLQSAKEVVGAIYHLTDNEWVVPTLGNMIGDLSMVYHLHEKAGSKNNDTTDRAAVNLLTSSKRAFHPRTKTAIMHDKFLVKDPGTNSAAVLMGSANFTPEALTVQANLLHTFRSKQMADLYAARHDLLKNDPAKSDTAKAAAWADVNDVPGMKIRAFFSPEPAGKRESIDAVVQAVERAKKSVVFCMFAPTDAKLLKALLSAGDKKKMMYGLLNSIQDPSKPKNQRVLDPEKATFEAKERYQVQTQIFHRSQTNAEVVAFDYFHTGHAPAGFLPELSTIDTSSRSLLPPSQKKAPAVHVHHKFIVIDGETLNPTVYTGSANMSNNSVHNNDENLLEIKGSTKLAQIYLAEFLRLYDHYRTRALYDKEHGAKKEKASAKDKKKGAGSGDGFVLKTTRDAWVRDAYTPGSLDNIARTQLVAPTA
jgi:phosphatidylserine/phosphatidylglycerophosphate/cardiolipin synthase-like enzyme